VGGRLKEQKKKAKEKKKEQIGIHREITILGLDFYILYRGVGHPLFFNLCPLGLKWVVD